MASPMYEVLLPQASDQQERRDRRGQRGGDGRDEREVIHAVRRISQRHHDLASAVRFRLEVRQERKTLPTLSGKTQINLFFEASTRTQGSFEIAGKRLGALVMKMAVRSSSVSKGETLIDTAATLNAMRPDVLVVRHSSAGASACAS